jgi:hypothetical protein
MIDASQIEFQYQSKPQVEELRTQAPVAGYQPLAYQQPTELPEGF